jgi:hypothetical protein
MGWPQITFIALHMAAFGMHLAKNGEPRGNYSSGGALIACAINFGLLYAGGFFS